MWSRLSPTPPQLPATSRLAKRWSEPPRAATYATGLTTQGPSQPREGLRRRAVDATARLAELHSAAGDSDGAAALEQAHRHDPYTEELYRRIMRLQSDLGRPDAVRRTYRLLQTRLADPRWRIP